MQRPVKRYRSTVQRALLAAAQNSFRPAQPTFAGQLTRQITSPSTLRARSTCARAHVPIYHAPRWSSSGFAQSAARPHSTHDLLSSQLCQQRKTLGARIIGSVSFAGRKFDTTGRSWPQPSRQGQATFRVAPRSSNQDQKQVGVCLHWCPSLTWLITHTASFAPSTLVVDQVDLTHLCALGRSDALGIR